MTHILVTVQESDLHDFFHFPSGEAEIGTHRLLKLLRKGLGWLEPTTGPCGDRAQ